MRWILAYIGLSIPLGAAESIVVPLALTPTTQPDLKGWGYSSFPKESNEVVISLGGGHVLVQRRGRDVLMDRNGDGRCDAADAPALLESQGMKSQDLIKFPISLGSATVGLPLSVSVLENALSLTSPCALMGSWEGQRVAIIDYRMDGRWDTQGEDKVFLEKSGRWQEVGALYPIMHMDGRFWSVVVDQNAPALRLTSDDAPCGQALVAGGEDLAIRQLDEYQATHVRLLSMGNQHHVTIRQGYGTRPVLVGTYLVEFGQLNRNGLSFQTDWEIPNQVTILDKQLTTLTLLPPVKLEAVVCPGEAKTLMVERLALVSADGFRWRACLEGRRNSGGEDIVPSWFLRGAGREQPLGKLDYG